MVIYNDPLVAMLKTAKVHNTFTYLDGKNVDAQQVDPAPWMAPSGSGDETKFNLTLDTTAAWVKESPVVSMIRKIDSPGPLNIKVTDTVEFSAATVGVFNLNSYTKPEIDGNSAIYKFKDFSVKVSWDWNGTVLHADRELCNGNHTPVYRLAVGTPKAVKHTGSVDIEICII